MKKHEASAEKNDEPGSSGWPGGGRVRPGVAGGVAAGPWVGMGVAGTGGDDDGDTVGTVAAVGEGVETGLPAVGEGVKIGLPAGPAIGLLTVGDGVGLGVAALVGVGGRVGSLTPGTSCSLMLPGVGIGDALPA